MTVFFINYCFFFLFFSRSIAAKENLEYSEYWDFLDCHIDLCTKAGLDKLENFLRQKSEKTRRCKTVAKSNSTISRYGIGSGDEIKRRLSFDNNDTDECDKIMDNKSNDDSNTITHKHSSPQVIRSVPSTWNEGECYCHCGKLLGNCEDCSVDIDIEKLTVSFSMCCNLNDNSPTSVDGDDVSIRNDFDSPVVASNLIPEVYIHG